MLGIALTRTGISIVSTRSSLRSFSPPTRPTVLPIPIHTHRIRTALVGLRCGIRSPGKSVLSVGCFFSSYLNHLTSVFHRCKWRQFQHAPTLLMLLSPVQTTTNALNLAADTLLLILTWVKTFEIRRASNGTGVRTPVSTLLLRDGKPKR